MRHFLENTVFGPNHRWWALCIVALAVLMATTDSGLLSISLPVIVAELRADLASAAWISFIYALVTASLYLPVGRLSDLVGRRRTFSAGFLLYAMSSAIAGLSQEPRQLILFRGLQGVGSALMMVNTFALVTVLFPPEERGRAMGISGGTISAIGFTIGPVFGGFLTHTFGWRSIFYVTACLGVLGFLASRFLLREEDDARPPRTTKEPFDFVGASAFSLGLSFLLVALTTGQRGQWDSWVVHAELVAAAATLGFFVWWEGRSPHPLLDLGLFRIRAFAAGNVARLTQFVAMSMNHLLMPFFLQLGLGLDPLRAGLLMTPTAIVLAVLSPVTGWLSERMEPRWLASAGLVIMGASCFVLSRLQPGAGHWEVVPGLVLLGLGLGFFQTPNNNALMSALPAHRLGVGSSFLSVVRSFGNSLGVATGTTIVSASLLAVTGQTSLQDLRRPGAAGLSGILLSAFMQGYRYSYLSAGLLCLAGALVSFTRNSRRS